MAALWSLLSKSWSSNDSVETAAELVRERTDDLAENTVAIDEIARVNEQLRACFETVKAANPSLFAILHAPSQETMTKQEMGELIKILAFATMTDLQSLREDLEEVRKKREQLQQLLGIWKRVEANFDQALASGSKAQMLDLKNIEDLTELQAMVQRLGVPPMCHSGSTLS